MPLRKRIAWVAASAVAVAVVIAAIVCYLVVRSQLLGQVDSALRSQAQAVAAGRSRSLLGQPPSRSRSPSAGGPAQYYQIVSADGSDWQGDVVDCRSTPA